MAYYKNELIDEILKKTDIVEMISETVQLKKKGRNYFGCCPFHNEKTASMSVSPEKQIFTCFGCGEGGNIIKFVMKKYSMEFIDAIEFIADKFNIDTSSYININESNTGKHNLKKRVNQINEIVAKNYYYYLKNTQNKEIKQYLKKREISDELIIKYGLGYGVCNKPLVDFLKDEGFSMEEILASELIKKQENSGKIWYYETFKNRIIFPIFDEKNRVVAFGGRTISEVTHKNPKYINSTENILYHKSEVLYGLNFAIQNPTPNIIVTEGYMDCLALYKSGITNAVASLGTALTASHVRLLKKYTDEVIMCYDQDEAGKNATQRAIDILKNNGLSVKIVEYDEVAKDPDEYISKYGVEKFKNCIVNAKNDVEYKIKIIKEKNAETNNTTQLNINYINSIIDIISNEKNEILREIEIKKFSKELNVPESAVHAEISKKMNFPIKNNEVIINENILKEKKESNKMLERYIIYLLLSNNKKIINRIYQNILPEYINDSIIRELYREIKNKEINNHLTLLSIINDKQMENEISSIMMLDLKGYDKDKLLDDIIKNVYYNKYIKDRDATLEKIASTETTKDEKEILQVQLLQILKKINQYKCK